LHPKHVVFATGHAGEAKIPTFPGQQDFKGTVYHASFHRDASLTGDATGKKVVVIGTGNSGHDISQNYYENGASVTMVQRAGTYVISASKGLFELHKGMYDEGGPPTEAADIAGQSLPIPAQFALNVGLTAKIQELEKESLDGLTKAGFKLDFGDDKSGIYRKYITRGGGYYIDVGCSQLIIDGKIKVQQSPNGISHFEPDGLVLADGTKLEADIVVLATGYDNMRTSARKIFGDTVADRCKDVWDLDEEGEVNAVRISPRRSFMYLLIIFCRCGGPVVTRTFGLWAVVLHFAELTRGSLPCRSRPSRRVLAARVYHPISTKSERKVSKFNPRQARAKEDRE
jgi:cation diffusion facilitator CzcD-associated flavoprotein CzcO